MDAFYTPQVSRSAKYVLKSMHGLTAWSDVHGPVTMSARLGDLPGSSRTLGKAVYVMILTGSASLRGNGGVQMACWEASSEPRIRRGGSHCLIFHVFDNMADQKYRSGRFPRRLLLSYNDASCLVAV